MVSIKQIIPPRFLTPISILLFASLRFGTARPNHGCEWSTASTALNSTCGGFVTCQNNSIDLENVGSDWSTLQAQFKDNTVAEIDVKPDMVVRICSNLGDIEDRCKIFENSVSQRNKTVYDIKAIVSATCTEKDRNSKSCNSEGCKSKNVELGVNECAKLYQSKSCNDCNFNAFTLGTQEDFTIQHQTVESIAIKEGYVVRIIHINDTSDVKHKMDLSDDIPSKFVLPSMPGESIQFNCAKS